MSSAVEICDVTLRDGAQGPGIKFSADDQLRIVRALDEFGIHFIEGGQPGSNPKAADFFRRVRDIPLAHATVAAFGSTRHPKHTVEDDPNLRALIDAGTSLVTIFAKSSRKQVLEVLRIGLDANLRLIEESIVYLKALKRRVFLDAEHFFDAYSEDPAYATTVLEHAWHAGAESLILCDTNGGRLPHEIAAAIRTVGKKIPGAALGIHAHNDCGCGVANTLAAVLAGALHVQGTINGYGERTGNANLCSIIPNLQLKMSIPVVPPERLATLTRLSHIVAEWANLTPRDSDPFVGRDAFTHKAGMHVNAVKKTKSSYEHIDPESVGNRTRITVSEMSGRANLLHKASEFGIDIAEDNAVVRTILDRVKELESEGYEFEGADASLELLLRKARGTYRTFFTLRGYHASVNQPAHPQAAISEATIKLDLPDGTRMHTAAEGDGPVDALNAALRKALEGCYPELRDVHLEDYKVRILNAQAATQATTRVLIESSDAEETWSTVGVSENIITASYQALVDSIEYKLLRTRGHAEPSA